MAIHQQEMMEDGETFRSPVVLAYHAAWHQHLEQGRATLEDKVIRLKLRRALVWHRVAPPTNPHPSAPSLPTNLWLSLGPRSALALSVIQPSQGTGSVPLTTKGCVSTMHSIKQTYTCVAFAFPEYRGFVTTKNYIVGARASKKWGMGHFLDFQR